MKQWTIMAMMALAPGCAKTQADQRQKPADNTQNNAQDRKDGAKTPFDQGQNKADIDIAAQIRKEVVGQGHLSTNAKNVKIISEAGVVTLRGPVASQDERTAIVTIANKVAGVQRVDDQLEIVPN